MFVRNAPNVRFCMRLLCGEHSGSCGPFLFIYFILQYADIYCIETSAPHSVYLSNWNLYFSCFISLTVVALGAKLS